jgi:2,4-dienoyl-CoA reductase-like NADH-dependent reductase (Old Yellow Enzyme family)
MTLHTPFRQRDIEFRNRLGVSPMCMYSACDGHADDFHLVHLGARALGGFGLIIAEATAVEARGRITPDDLGIWADSHVEGLGRIARFVRRFGAVAAIQLAHAGWKAGTRRPWEGQAGDWTPVGPSGLAFTPSHRVADEIADPRVIVRAFADAARRALLAGFELIELHAAHGYLMHSFHSPISNLRGDGYGGGFEGRTRLTREIVAAVREVWPERLPLWIRFSCTDYLEPDGWRLEDSVRLARELKGMGVDCVDCSSGGIKLGVKIEAGPGYQVRFAETIRREAGIATAAVGNITTHAQAEAIVSCGQADVVLLAREALRDAEFPIRSAREAGVKPAVPPQHDRAY